MHTAQIQYLAYYLKYRKLEFEACPFFIMVVVAGQCIRPNRKSALAAGMASCMLALLS
jgi:hypothetical protein